jgi:hypothetical protein
MSAPRCRTMRRTSSTICALPVVFPSTSDVERLFEAAMDEMGARCVSSERKQRTMKEEQPAKQAAYSSPIAQAWGPHCKLTRAREAQRKRRGKEAVAEKIYKFKRKASQRRSFPLRSPLRIKTIRFIYPSKSVRCWHRQRPRSRTSYLPTSQTRLESEI